MQSLFDELQKLTAGQISLTLGLLLVAMLLVQGLTEIIRGCAFAPRCAHVMPVCRENVPALAGVQGPHKAACFLHHSLIGENADAA